MQWFRAGLILNLNDFKKGILFVPLRTMQSKRLNELLREMEASEAKAMLWVCKQHKDKRFKILETIIVNRNLPPDQLLNMLEELCRKNYKSQNIQQIKHTVRRLSDFFCQELERIFFENSDSFQKLIYLGLGKHFKKKGNIFLGDLYYGKSYEKINQSDTNEEIGSVIPPLISLQFMKGTKESYLKGLELNEKLNSGMEFLYHKTKVDYYNNLSNIYLENKNLGQKSTEELIGEINHFIRLVKNPDLIIGYRISQMRLSYGTPDFNAFARLTESYFDSLDNQEKVEILFRKYLFLKLVLGFYSGGNKEELILTARNILAINKKSQFLDNTTVFYLSVLLILSNRDEESDKLLAEQKNCFKQNFRYLKEFIEALVFLKQDNLIQAKRKLNRLIDHEDYFIEQFSRVFLIYIFRKQKDNVAMDSMLRATERKIQTNSDKRLINDSTIYFLDIIKKNRFQKKLIMPASKSLSNIHDFLLLRL